MFVLPSWCSSTTWTSNRRPRRIGRLEADVEPSMSLGTDLFSLNNDEVFITNKTTIVANALTNTTDLRIRRIFTEKSNQQIFQTIRFEK
jgi:hypothetical protein